MSGLLLVVPSAEEGAEARRLLALADALAAQPDVELTTLLWNGGPLAGDFGAHGVVVDAGEVNTWGPAKALARARLTPAARLAKNRRLRALLAPLQGFPAVVVGGIDGVAALGWLPSMRTAVVVRGAPARPTPELAGVDVLVAGDVEAESWLTSTAGLPAARVRRHALLEGPEPAATAGDRLGLVGWTAEEVGRLLAGRAMTGEAVAATWFVPEEKAWGLWQGPTASPLAGQVRVADPRARTEDLADLALLLIGEPGGPAADLAALAATFGVRVHRLGAHAVDAAKAITDAGSTAPVGWTAAARTGAAALATELLAGT